MLPAGVTPARFTCRKPIMQPRPAASLWLGFCPSSSAVAGVGGGEVGHDDDELEVAGDGVGVAVGRLPDFEEAGDLVIDLDGDEEQEVVGGVAGGGAGAVGGGGAALRRQADGPRLHHRLAEQLVVTLAPLLAGVE